MKKERFLPLLIILSLALALNLVSASALAETAIETQAKQEDSHTLSYKKVQLLKTKQRITINGNLKDKTLSIKSSNASVLKVVSHKKNYFDVSAVSTGTTTITVKITDNSGLFFMNNTKTLRGKITVTPKAVSVKFKKSTYKMTAGQSKKLKITLRPSISKEVPIYSSKKISIATIDAKGVVTAKKPGTTYIYATLSNKVKARCKVVVS